MQNCPHFIPRTRQFVKCRKKKTIPRCNIKMTEMLELSDKDEAVVIRMLQQKIANMFKTNKR